MLGALHSLEIQPSPCFPKGYKPRAKQIVPHILFLGWLHRQFSRLSGRYQSHHPHTAALPFRVGGTLSSASIIVQASVCRGALDYGEVQERCKSRVQIESGFGGSRSETCKGEPSASAKAATIRAAAASFLTTPATWLDPAYKPRSCSLLLPSRGCYIILPHGSSTPFQAAQPNFLVAACP